jgi:RNA polymerase sigma factor (sigma-70 family)
MPLTMGDDLTTANRDLSDSQVFWNFWEAHNHALKNFCRHMLRRNDHDVDDVMSDVMLKAYHGLSRHLIEHENPKAWLWRVAYHTCLRWLKTNATNSRYVGLIEEIDYETTSSHSSIVEDMLVKHELQDRVLQLIEELPERLRDPFILYIFHGMSYQDIADKFKITQENARKRVQQARDSLRSRMGAFFSEAPGALGRTSAMSPISSSGATSRLRMIEGQVERLLHEHVSHEIEWEVNETREVQVQLPTGVTVGYHILLGQKHPRRDSHIASLRQYIERHPRGWKKHLELAEILFALGRWDEAIGEYRVVTTLQPGHLNAWLQLGLILRLLEREDEAVTVYQESMQHARRPATRHCLLGMIALCRESLREAAQEFKQAVALEPSNIAYLHALGDVYVRAGRLVEALQIFDEILARNPDDVTALVNSHSPLLDTGRWAELERRLTRALTLNPNDALALAELARIRFEHKMLHGPEGRETLRLLKRAARLAPDAANIQWYTALFYLTRGEAARAVSLVRAFLQSHLDSSHAWYYYAFVLRECRDFQPAIEAAAHAYRLDPHNYYIAILACELFLVGKRTADLQSVVEELLAQFPERWDVQTTAGRAIALGLGDEERGCQIAARALQLQPDFPFTWQHYAQLLFDVGRYREAQDAWYQCWERIHADAGTKFFFTFAFSIANCHHRLSEFEQAREWYQRSYDAAMHSPHVTASLYARRAREALAQLGTKE